MSVFARRVGRALARNHAETTVADVDPRLRGRTYAIPFERVWQTARALAGARKGEGLSGWQIVSSDDQEGVIKAESATPVFRFVDDVVIRITLDANAQTRVDLTSRSRKGSFDFGANARRIGKFLRALDRKLGVPRARAEQILQQ